MGKIFSLLVAGLLFIGLTSPSIAADIINEDAVDYTVLVDGMREVLVPALADIPAICNSCTIQIVDSVEPPVQTSENSFAFINSGKFIVQN